MSQKDASDVSGSACFFYDNDRNITVSLGRIE